MKKHVNTMIAAIMAMFATTAIGTVCWKNSTIPCPGSIEIAGATCTLSGDSVIKYPFVDQASQAEYGRIGYQSTTNRYCDYICNGSPYGPVYYGAQNSGATCRGTSGSS